MHLLTFELFVQIVNFLQILNFYIVKNSEKPQNFISKIPNLKFLILNKGTIFMINKFIFYIMPSVHLKNTLLDDNILQ